MRKNLKTIFKLYLELRVRKRINNNAFNLDCFFFGQKYAPLNSLVFQEASVRFLFK